MSRLVYMGMWLLIAVSFVVLTHYYLWTRLVRTPALTRPWSHLLTATLVGLAAMLVGSVAAMRALPQPIGRSIAIVAFTWLGFLFILLMVQGGVDLVSLAWSGIMRVAHAAAASNQDPVRRVFLARMLGGGVALVALGMGGMAVAGGMSLPQVVRVPVTLRRLPRGLHGLRIAQISDLHVSTVTSREQVEQMVASVNALSPDLVAITGDLVDGTVESLRHTVQPLADLEARYGVFFVTGNHEYYSGVGPWLDELARLGIRVLRNERVSIGTGDDTFDLAGIDDITAHRLEPGHGADVARAVAGRDTSRELVLLAHQPRSIYDAASHGVGLMLSGHTHGGQIWPFGLLVRLVQPYIAGLALHGETHIYVSRGTGSWGPPMRLGAPSEVTLLELHAPSESDKAQAA